MKKNKTWHICADWSPRYVIRGCKVQKVKNILIIFGLLVFLFGCSSQDNNQKIDSSSMTSNTSSIVDSTVEEEDLRLTIKYRKYNNCNYINFEYFDSSEFPEFHIVLNPDGNNLKLNFAMGTNDRTYYGEFKRVEDNLFFVELDSMKEKNINPMEDIDYKEGPEMYFLLDDDKLFFVEDTYTLNKEEYDLNKFCVLEK